MSSTIQMVERRIPLEINAGSWIRTVLFSPDGEHLVRGGYGGIQVWRVRLGHCKKIATMPGADIVYCAAVSKDGRKIAAGTIWGEVFVWNAETHKEIFKHKEDNSPTIHGLDFSPDATRLVMAASSNRTASVWDIAMSIRVLLLPHDMGVIAAKYSPRGDKVATATLGSIRIYDSNDGRLLVDIKVTVSAAFNKGFLWFNNHLLVVSNNKIKQIDPSTLSTVSEWLVPDSNQFSSITLPKHGRFITYSTDRTVTFWDISTHTQLGLIHYPQDIWSIAVSPDNEFLAIGGADGKIVIESLHPINAPAHEKERDERPAASGDHGDDLPNFNPEEALGYSSLL